MEESLGLNVGDLPDLHPRHAVGVRLFWGQAELCDANDARRVLTFLDHHANSAEKLHLVVHCHAGISRSAAVAAIAADRFGIEIDQANPDLLCQYGTSLVLWVVATISLSFVSMRKVVSGSCCIQAAEISERLLVKLPLAWQRNMLMPWATLCLIAILLGWMRKSVNSIPTLKGCCGRRITPL